jgi:AsmA protein
VKSTWIKVVLAIVVVLFVVAAAIPLFVNAERFRPEIESRLSTALNRTVSIGKLSFSLLSGGISASDITISDDPAFSHSPFLQAKSLDVGVEIWPLLTSRQINVTSIEIVQPSVFLLQNASGKWNFSSMGAASGSGGGNPAPAAKAPPSGGEKPSNASAPLSIKKLTIKDGRVQITSGGQTQNYTDFKLTAENVGASTPASFDLQAKTPGSGKLQLQGTAGPLAPDAAATPFNATLELTGLKLAQYLGGDSGIDGVADLNAKLASAQGIVHAQGTLKTSELKLAKNGTPAQRPVTLDFDTAYNLSQSQVRIERGDLHVGGSVAHITGAVDARGMPVLNINVNEPSLAAGDLDKILPVAGVSLPSGVSLQSGTVAANLNVNGPVQQMLIAGPVHGANLRLSGFDLGSKLKGIGPLAGINSGPNTDIQLLDAKVRISPQGTRLDGIDAVVVGAGTITGQGTIAPNNALDFRLAIKLANAGGAVGDVMQMAGLANFKNAIPVHVTGTTSNPSFTPDLSNVMTAQNPGGNLTGSQALKNPGGAIGNALQGLFGKKK